MQLLIDARLMSQGEGTGVEVYAKNVISGLISAHPDTPPTLFYNAWRTASLPPPWTASGARVVNWQIPNKIYDLWQPAIDRHIPADIVYSPHINYLRVDHAPHVMTIHDLSFIHYPQFFPLKYRLWHARQRVLEQARSAAAIIANSAYTKEDIVSTLGIDPGKVHVAWPGIDTPALDPATMERLPPRKQELLRAPYVLVLSTLEPRKNIPAALSAFARLRRDPRFAELNLIVAGGKRWRFAPAPQDGVIWWGGVSQAEKALLYTEAQALLFPSFFEGFGFPPLEAQSYGCPVIASDRSSLPEILGASALLVDPWHADRFADALEAVLTDTALRNELIADGFANTHRFDWNTTTCALSDIFASLAP